MKSWMYKGMEKMEKSVKIILFFLLCHSWAFAQTRLPEKTGELRSEDFVEISGMAASVSHPGLYWVHNDGDHEPVIYLMDLQGYPKGSLTVQGVTNKDWEDVAVFEWQKRSYILIGDVGDNLARRPNVQLHLLAEPALTPQKNRWTQAPQASIRLTYQEGARDCEALGVDVDLQKILLISKRDDPPRLYSLPLERLMKSKGWINATANLEGALPTITGYFKTAIFQALLGKIVSLPTALDIDARGQFATVLTYGYVFQYERAPGQNWIEAFQQSPVVHKLHDLPQAEAVAIAREGGRFFVVSEGRGTPILGY